MVYMHLTIICQFIYMFKRCAFNSFVSFTPFTFFEFFRSCGQRFSDGCVILQDYLGFKQIRCICSEDLCNEGNEMLNLYHINELCSGSEVILSSKIKLLLLSATTAVIAVVNV